ncbi:UDP-N-acetylenolpyruvoylglucosamine reductase [Verrucomicrobia bacterium LW23]|nr:UDP-N-acetylenolpyruvoylglucosamine reductase [Verrucomicrobia bacterium LW23]
MTAACDIIPTEVKPAGCVESLRKCLAAKGSHVHLIGVGGSGMSGIARLLMQHGHKVSGSDLSRSGEVERLAAEGVVTYRGHEAANVGDACLVVYSSAITAANPERQEAERRGIVCVRRAECLAILSEQKEALVVAGMHGKTTTSSMLAHVLRRAERRCSHYIGAEVPILGANAAWDEGEHFVIEGDESDGTVALYHPARSILLNIEEEHLDYFGTLEKILATFAQVIEQTRGPVYYCADDKNALLLCSKRKNTVGYGFSEIANYRVTDLKLDNFSSRFTVLKEGVSLGEVMLNVPGAQNVSNAAGVIAMAHDLGVPMSAIVAALGDFRGARRRFEVKFKGESNMVVDDYAHHPTEVKATLAAAKNSGWKRVIALFQPHRYSRTKLLLNDFAEAFHDAHEICLTEIYAASEKPLDGISGERLAEVVRESGHKAVFFEPRLDRLRSLVSRSLQDGDLILTMGAGDIHKVAAFLAQELSWYHGLRALLKEESVLLRQEPMSRHTTMKIGGPAQLWLEPCDEEDLIKALRYAGETKIPVTVIGRGSNLLVRDGGIRGLCLHLKAPYFNRVSVTDDVLEVGAGVRLKTLVAEGKKYGIGGFEFMEGIPGNLGGALRMNAGAMQGWTMEVVEEVRTVDTKGNVYVINKKDLEVRYRNVPHFHDHIAISARLKGKPCDSEAITERLKQFSEKRWASQPAASSAGCIFKNPGQGSAGKIIDELGLKNLAVGGARVSEVHANFIVNDGQATAQNVLDLIAQIQQKARDARGIDLETEVIIMGEDE